MQNKSTTSWEPSHKFGSFLKFYRTTVIGILKNLGKSDSEADNCLKMIVLSD